MAVCPNCKNLIEEPVPTETLKAHSVGRREWSGLVVLVVCPNCNTVLGAIPEEVAIPEDVRVKQ